MKQSARWYRAFLLAVTVALALLVVPAASFAEDASSYDTSITINTSLLPDGYFHWYGTRQPIVSFFASNTVEIDPIVPIRIGGFEYRLWRNGGTVLDTAYAPVGGTGGPLSANTVDLSGWTERQTGPMPAGAVDPIEGVWNLSANTLAVSPLGARTTPPRGPAHTVSFGIDVTPPSMINTPSVSSLVTSAGVISGTVADFSWPDSNGGVDYDSLSTTAQWKVKVNGGFETTFYRVPAQAPTATVTVENLALGANLVEIAAVDWAGNTGPYRTVAVFSKAAPTVFFAAPAGSVLAAGSPVTAGVSDGAVNPTVTIKLDGTIIATGTTVPLTVIPDLTVVAAGTHTLTATVVDWFGSSASTTKTVTWNPQDASSFGTSILVDGDALLSPLPVVHWFNTLSPTVGFSANSTVAPDAVNPVVIGGFDYQLWRNGGVPSYTAYAPVGSGGGPLSAATVDIQGWVEMQTGVAPAGAVDPSEGVWYLRANSLAVAPAGLRTTPPQGASSTVHFGVDVTPPSMVGTAAVASVVSSQGVIGGSVAILGWPVNNGGTDYDSLSGTWGWTIKLNGADVRSFARVPAHVPTATATIENLIVGRNIVEIAAVDNAGNTGAFRQIEIYSRPVAPTITLSEPASSALTAEEPFVALVGPALGVVDPTVTFRLNGAVVGSPLTSAPYSVVPDLTGLASGTYPLSATVVDRFGRTAIATKTVTWTRPVPVVSFITPAGSSLTIDEAIAADVVSAFGNPTVTISIDGTPIKSFTSAPYSVVPDVFVLSAGSHLISVSATNTYGTTTVNKTVTWDPPDASSFETSITVNGNLLPGSLFHWYNTPKPNVNFFAASIVGEYPTNPVSIAGFQYQLRRGSGVATYTAFAPVGSSGGPLSSASVDMAGWVERQTGTAPSNAVDPMEGIWHLRANSLADGPTGARITPPNGISNEVDFGIDVTPPSIVNAAVVTSVVTSQGVVAGSVADIAWPVSNGGTDYDKLSGTWGWTVKLNGAEVRTFARIPAQVTTATVTIEDLAPGANVVEVAAVDWAGNTGQYRTLAITSDPDKPTIEIYSPSGLNIWRNTPLQCVVQELGGVSRVSMTINGSTVTKPGTATIDPAPEPNGLFYDFTSDLIGVPAGTYSVVFTVTDLLGRQATVNKTVAVDLSRDTPGTLSGTVRSASTGNPLSGVTVTVEGYAPVTASVNGTYTVSGVAPGYYSVMFARTGYVSEPRNVAIDSFSTPPLDVYLELVVYPGSLSGTVTSGGSPLSGATVSVPGYTPVTTSVNGTYTVTGILPGNYDVSFGKSGYTAQVQPVTIFSGSAATRDISLAQIIPGTLSGVVTAGGNPLSGVSVSVPGYTPVTTAVDGSYTITGITAGSHVATFAKNGFLNQTLSATIYAGGTTYGNIALAAVPPGTLSGGVSAGGSPLSGVSVSVPGYAPVTTASDGSYSVSGIAAGSYVVGFAKSGYTSQTLSVVIAAGGTTTGNMSMVIIPVPSTARITAFSRNASIFYPIKRDKYKDYSYVYYTLNERASTTLEICDSTGAVIRTIKATGNAGRNKFTWDGKWSGGKKPRIGKYTYRVTATDAAGNSTSTAALSITIRNYELKKVGKNKVRVIRR